MKKFTFIFFLAVCTATVSVYGQWTNPISRNGEWGGSSGYGTGDPYILKYRGVYYLYCSTQDNNNGFKVWSTKDFVTWSDVTNGTSSPINAMTGAYAPEVIYWNGNFYMFASSNNQDHYMLSSTSPTGPFTSRTTGLGRAIDGSCFLDDNGQWYFHYAANNNIQGCTMTINSQTQTVTMGNGSGLGTGMGGAWTEGPTVIKRNGVYYVWYTGNHLTSRAYRVDYAKSYTSPLSGFSRQTAQNPVLINTEGKGQHDLEWKTANPLSVVEGTEHVGLGHGSAFIGPDLDSYYYVYHNLNYRPSGGGHRRKANIERITWNGDKMLLSPTSWQQQAMRMPDMSEYFDRATLGADWSTPNNGTWTIKNTDELVQEQTTGDYKVLYKDATGENYTAEFTLREESGNSGNVRFGAVFGYTDESNYGIVALNNNPSKQLEVCFKQDGTWGTSTFYALPAEYNFSAWHSLRIEKSETTYKFFIDGMHKATIINTLSGGKIGYMTSSCAAAFDYTAFSNLVNGSGAFDIYKPVPGIIASVHYITGGEGVGYHDLTPGSDGTYRNDDVDKVECSESGFAISSEGGEWYKYNLNVASAGAYHIGLRYSSTGPASVRVWHGDTPLTDVISLPVTAGNWWTHTLKPLDYNLPAGHQTIKIETVSGNVNLYEMRFAKADLSTTTLTDDFTGSSFSTNWNYAEGSWNISSGEAVINGYGKRTMGTRGLTDYTVSVDMTFVSTFDAGIIVRVNNPALGGAGADLVSGTIFLQGYYVGLLNNGVQLAKLNYNSTELVRTTGESFAFGTKYNLRVEVQGPSIRVYVDNILKIDYTDTDPIFSGKAGLKATNCNVKFDNFILEPSNLEYVQLADMTLNKHKIFFPSGSGTLRDTLRTIITPDNATSRKVLWTTSNSNVATLLNDSIIVPGRTVGTTIITATALEGGFTDSCTVTIVRVATNLTLDKSALALSVGDSELLTATAITQGTTTNPSNEPVEWSSSDSDIATVDEDGTVRAVSNGTAVITARTTPYSNLTATCTVTVAPSGIADTQYDMPLQVYPNPTTGMLNLEFKTAGKRTVTISDLSGKILLSKSVNNRTARIDIKNYPADVYLLIIDDGKQKNTMRIVKN